jgi:dipeptidyl aminopeptidase/acylaminoacyl peptidase
MRPTVLCALLISSLTLPAAAALAQAPPGAGEVTLERIMADPDWIGNSPEEGRFADDGRAVYFERKRVGETIRDLYRLDLETGETRVVEDAERGQASVAGGDWSADGGRKVFVREGDVFVRSAETGELRQLTRTAEDEADARFMVGEERVSFRRGDTFFIRDLATGLESQAAVLLLEKDPRVEEEPEDAAVEYLDAQQERLFDVLRERKRREEAAAERERAARRADPTRPPLPFYLGDEVAIVDRSLSPRGDRLLVVLGPKEPDEGTEDKMPRFVTRSGYVEVEDVRPKVGTPKPKSPQLVLFDLAAHRRYDLDLEVLPGIHDDPLAELRGKADTSRGERKKARETKNEAATAEDKAVAAAESAPVREDDELEEEDLDEEGDEESAEPATAGGEAGDEATEPDDAAKDEKPKPRVVTAGEIAWSDDGSRLAVELNSFDFKDRWLAQVDLAEPALRPLERITDPAWINWDYHEMGWLRDNATLWYLSEESGWSQLWLRPVDGAKRRLTSGDYTVETPVLSRDGVAFFLTGNREHTAHFDVYRVDVASGATERLTTLGGLNTFVLSPDERSLLVSHSSIARRPELYLQEVAAGAEARRLTESVSPEFAAIDWTMPEIVPVPSTHHSRPIWSRLYLPPGAPAGGEGPRPAVVFIHGAGYLQNAHAGWSYYFREFMFHTLLTRRGWVVLDMDYRASAGYGRDWRTAIYRQMGWPEVEDLEDGVAWLSANHGVDPARVGVYGGSYGGFLTFMSLFRKPDLFAAGAALRPVTDWAHYNHEYTSAILNTPEVDPEAYEKSSPIEFAAGLRKPVLICHGMVDDNVVFQDTARLVQRLIELEKSEWFETAIYPVESHSFVEPSSWLDEYKRILELFETNLR